MYKLIKNIILTLFVTIGLSSCDEGKFVEYKPHYFDKESREKSYGNAKLDPVEFTHTIQLLKYYGNEYKTENGNIILISKELNNNWELMWNYTTKANDVQWIKNHTPINEIISVPASVSR